MSTTLPEQSSVVMVESVPWYKNKVYVGILSVVVIAGIGLGIYFGTKKKSTDTPSTSITGKAGADAQQAAPVDAQWSSWGECKKDTDGIWKRYRTCTQEGKNGGKTCSQGTKVENCEVVNGGWSVPKDSDAVCQLKTDSSGKAVKDSAGREIWVKKRVCDNPVPQNGGAGCIGDAEVRCEPVNGNWGSTFNNEVCLLDLTADSKPVQDPEGRRIYSRTIECIPPKYGGFDCPAFADPGVTVNKENGVSKTARKICETTDGRWGEFGTCALKSSGSKDTVKTRVCILPKLEDKTNADAGKPCTSEYPLFNLTNNNDSGYIISASSVDPFGAGSGYEPWNAFDGNPATYWHSHDSSVNHEYNPSTGVYNGVISTLVGTKLYLGEWIQIQFPPTTIHSTFKPIAFKITPRTDWVDGPTRRSPRNFVLLGSNNGTTWSIIYDNTADTNGIKDWTGATRTFSIAFDVPAPGYRYFRLVITRVGNDCPIEKEVFQVRDGTGYNTSRADANAVCAKYGATLSTKEQLENDWKNGADWCSTGWVSNDSTAHYPINTTLIDGCSRTPAVVRWTPDSGKADVNCYGIKPASPQGNDFIFPFNKSFYNKPCSRKSVQIAEFKIMGTPYIPTATSATEVFQVSETIPCNVDCRWKEWKPVCSKSGDKWIQERESIAPVGAGKECSLVDGGISSRDCPSTGSWSGWGAFCQGSVCSGTGPDSQFVEGQTYAVDGVAKQTRICKRTESQACPTGESVRNVFSAPTGQCGLQNDGFFRQPVIDYRTNTTAYQSCTPSNEFKGIGDVATPGWYLIRNVGTGQYMWKTGSAANDGEWVRPGDNTDYTTWWSFTKKDGTPANRIRGLNADNNRCVATPSPCDYSWFHNITNRNCDTHPVDTEVRQFQYNPATKQIRVGNGTLNCHGNNQGSCLGIVSDNTRITTQACDITNSRQRWDLNFIQKL